MKKWLISGLLILGVGIIGALLSFNGTDWRNFGTKPYFEEKTVDLGDARKLHIESVSLDVKVIPGNGQMVVVRLEGKASPKFHDNFAFSAERAGDTIEIESSMDNYISFGLNIVDVKLTVELPKQSWDEMTLESRSGNILVRELEAKGVKINMNSGNSVIEKIHAATLDFAGTSGNLKIIDTDTEQLNFKLNSGNAVVSNTTGVTKGKTNSGNIVFRTDSLQHSLTLQARTGNINVETNQEPASAWLKATVSSGNIKNNWSGLAADAQSEHSLTGGIGGANSNAALVVELETTSGNIRVGR
ncbi:DUF4097 family beta strand repeat-containing protein [Paenibacillus sp. NPDC058071]|uniref:DUF4097 family beta strand repeat-containing protein n=1 Tax=Paenibacillus sp. NPDC058071 TaxID=3346326 RepID=UPI0036DE4A3C